jgi:hypothetical protein
MPLAVLGLVVATLVLASLHQRYQVHQAQIRTAVRRIENQLLAIEEALAHLARVPLSRELRVLLRADVLARYRRIAKLHRGYPDIKSRVAEAETAMHGEGAPPGGGVGTIDSEQQFRQWLGALDALREVVHFNALCQPLPRDVKTIFERELGERRAEVLARFHLIEARRLEAQGDITKARAHLTTLMQRLRRQGPSTEFVQALYAEAEQALVALGRRAFEPDDADVAAPERDAREAQAAPGNTAAG